MLPKGKGDGVKSIEPHVEGDTATGMISASQTPSNQFKKESAGHVGVLTPGYFRRRAHLQQRYPQSSEALPGDMPQPWHDHETVMENITDSRNEQRAREADEVLFRGPIPLANVVVLDQGIQQTPAQRDGGYTARSAKKMAAAAKEATEKEANPERRPSKAEKNALKSAKSADKRLEKLKKKESARSSRVRDEDDDNRDDNSEDSASNNNGT